MIEKYICIDIGGTDIKYGLADKQGNLLTEGKISTEALIYGGKGIMTKIEKIIADYLAKEEIAGIAISTAGMVDPDKGSIIYALEASIPDYTGIEIKKIIEDKFNLPCWVENDVNCAALGEMWLGAGKDAKTIFCITVGTSIGGCAVHKGEVIHGASYSAGEIAYMKIPKGRMHDLVSTCKLRQDVANKKQLNYEDLDGKTIFHWAKIDKDPEVIASINILIQDLADGIGNIVSVLNPNTIILGGGIMAQSEYLAPLLQVALAERLVPQILAKTEIKFAQLGNKAGMLGALYNLLQRSNTYYENSTSI